MNKYLLLILMALGLNTASGQIGLTDSAFSYQGELIDNGSPANGDYDITVSVFADTIGGSEITSQAFPATPVSNGLFNLEIDFGDVVYEEFFQYYLELSVTASAGGTTAILAPRTKLLSVPYATQAQFSAYGGDNWEGDAAFQYSLGKVAIGSDFEGDDRLYVNSSGSENALRVRTPNGTKLHVKSNGGTSLGITTDAPNNGLFVQGDVKQSVDSNGMPKFMLRAICSANPNVNQQYNGTDVAGNATIVRNNNDSCTITLPFDISNSFFTATPDYIGGNTSTRAVNCQALSDTLLCRYFVGTTGSTVSGAFNVIVY